MVDGKLGDLHHRSGRNTGVPLIRQPGLATRAGFVEQGTGARARSRAGSCTGGARAHAEGHRRDHRGHGQAGDERHGTACLGGPWVVCQGGSRWPQVWKLAWYFHRPIFPAICAPPLDSRGPSPQLQWVPRSPWRKCAGLLPGALASEPRDLHAHVAGVFPFHPCALPGTPCRGKRFAIYGEILQGSPCGCV
jgi:hypothetical protein